MVQFFFTFHIIYNIFGVSNAKILNYCPYICWWIGFLLVNYFHRSSLDCLFAYQTNYQNTNYIYVITYFVFIIFLLNINININININTWDTTLKQSNYDFEINELSFYFTSVSKLNNLDLSCAPFYPCNK